MIRLLAILAVFLVAACSAIQKKNSACTDDNECWRDLRGINSILAGPRFHLLLDSDGHLNLDCSQAVQDTASQCTDDDIRMCNPGASSIMLRAALKYFCNNKAEVETTEGCWENKPMRVAITGCRGLRMDAVPECMGRLVSNVQGCNEAAGRTIAGVLRAIYSNIRQHP